MTEYSERDADELTQCIPWEIKKYPEKESQPAPLHKIVDTAEPGSIREKLMKVGWMQQRLYSGDYSFFSHDYHKVGITRKTTQDLLQSIGDTFSKQLEEMLDTYAVRIILLEGRWVKIQGDKLIVDGIVKWGWDMVWNYLRRWQDKGFTLEITVDEGHTIHRLNSLYALYQKPYSLSAGSRGFTDDRVLAMPSGLRGKSGAKILEGRSLAEVAQMTVEELKQVEDIGDKRAQLVYNHFRKKNSKNGSI